jgi:hypothetical protein
MGATATLREAALAVEPGSQAQTEIRVRNDGAVVDQFTIDIVGDAAGWATVEPATLSLFPGAEETAKVTFKPPRASTTPPGSMPFGVRVRSKEDPAGSAVEEGALDVGSYVEPFAELVPRTSRGSRSGSHEIAIDNRGNARLNADITASDPDQLLAFDIEPPGVVVDAGTAGFAKVRVKPTQTFLRGPNKSRAFSLVVQPAGYQPLVLDGSMLQESILPPWFLKALLALIAALVLLILFFVFALRPALESTASAAVQKPVEELRAKVNDSLKAGGLPTVGPLVPGATAGTGGATPTPGPTGGATPTPGPPVIAGLGTPVDGRLSGTGPTFTAEGTVFITDLVFGNPRGRTGNVRLRRDDDTLMELRLENFRDLDFHFVTPITLSDGESLILDLVCEAVATADDCDPSVFYSGFTRSTG